LKKVHLEFCLAQFQTASGGKPFRLRQLCTVVFVREQRGQSGRSTARPIERRQAKDTRTAQPRLSIEKEPNSVLLRLLGRLPDLPSQAPRVSLECFCRSGVLA